MNYGILIKITMLQYKPILDIFVQYFDVTFSFFFMKPLRRIMMTNLNILAWKKISAESCYYEWLV